jgi:hypothetical protein
MLTWITKSRFRTAIAILLFLGLFIVSAFYFFLLHDSSTAGISLITGIVSAIGTISTVILAWRADRRSARESDLKMIQLQQQIAELQRKLDAPKPVDNQMV